MKELITVQKRMNHLFESALAREFDSAEAVDTWTPVCEVSQTETATILSVELPGFRQEEIDLRLEGDEVIVSGERRMSSEQPGEHFHRVERPYGRFSRRFHLPSSVERDAVGASFDNGVLEVTLPHEGGRTLSPTRVTIS